MDELDHQMALGDFDVIPISYVTLWLFRNHLVPGDVPEVETSNIDDMEGHPIA